jgi:CheY-like chemotaxis protein
MGLDALTGSIVHDVNNLLVAIIGHARLVGTDAGLHGQSLAIEHAALRAAELTNQLVDYAEKSSLAFRELDVSELLTEMRALLAGSVSASTEINFILEARLPRVRGDASQLRQVAMNLVTNAADALADRPGSITVRTGRLEPDGGDEARVSSAVYLEVSDTGSGMDEATLVKIFDPFFTTKQAGRGLGMAIVVGIVRGHGGTIAVDSSVAGTTVRISLPGLGPRGEIDSGLHCPAAVATREAAAGTVLVVDDDEGVRVVTRMMMEQAGYRVLTARDGQEAVDIFQAHGDAITVVLLDLKIPKLDSREVFEIVHRVRPDIPVVLSSGYPEAEARRRFGTSEFAAYVPKPYTQRLLLKQIQQVLGT